MLWTDVDPEHEAEFNRWYNEEHIHHLLKVPGFLSAGRYEALSGGPEVFWRCTSSRSRACCGRSAFLDARCASARRRGAPRPRAATSGATTSCRPTARSTRRATNPGRADHGAVAVSPDGTHGHPAPRWKRSGTPGTTPSTFLTTSRCPASCGCARFMVVEGQPKYLTVYEFERPDVPKSEAWNAGPRPESRGPTGSGPFMKLDAGSPAVFQAHLPDPV